MPDEPNSPPKPPIEEDIAVSKEEWESLKRDEMLRHLELDLETRLKRRFTMILIVAAVVSVFGIQGIASILLTPVITRVQHATARAEVEVDAVVEQIKKAKAAKEQADEALVLAQKQLDQAREATERADEALGTVQRQSDSANELVIRLEKQTDAFLTNLKKRSETFQFGYNNFRYKSDTLTELINTVVLVKPVGEGDAERANRIHLLAKRAVNNMDENDPLRPLTISYVLLALGYHPLGGLIEGEPKGVDVQFSV